jgi:ribonuclease HII
MAKTYRDELMASLSASHPEYGWERNVGYPTKEHRKAIEKYGITPYHRKSFRLLPQLQLFT